MALKGGPERRRLSGVVQGMGMVRFAQIVNLSHLRLAGGGVLAAVAVSFIYGRQQSTVNFPSAAGAAGCSCQIYPGAGTGL
mgnify:CR=1 FL=1